MQRSPPLRRWDPWRINFWYRSYYKSSNRRASTKASRSRAQKWDCGYDCDMPAEPLHRYCLGGYHPIKLGDYLQDKRYRILQKLGWGGYSTTWAARDERDQKNVALKITTADHGHSSLEAKVMLALAESKLTHPGSAHIRSPYDHFKIQGPNGSHECLILELLGPNVSDVIERTQYSRLPATAAKTAAKQALLALDTLHQHYIVHGGWFRIARKLVVNATADQYLKDLHVRNLACTLPELQTCSERKLDRILGPPDIGLVRRRDGEPSEPMMPEYLVSPASFSQSLLLDASTGFKLIDMGEAFLESDPPTTLHTPLVVRSPEAIFNDKLDHRTDLWSMGCMLFELITGQPPFDNVMVTAPSLVSEILDTTGDALPQRWRDSWRSMLKTTRDHDDDDGKSPSLQDWLEEVYLDGKEADAEFSKADLRSIGELIGRMLRVEPGDRAEAREILRDSWFRNL